MKNIDEVYLNENKRIINKPSGSDNKNLMEARKNRDDELYTKRENIESEVYNYYKFKYFKDKTVFLNCDDPKQSQFWFYFHTQFNFLGIKKLIATHYGSDAYALIVERTESGEKGEIKQIPLKSNGDFRSDECIEFLKESDIVCTNPPFSLFRDYMKQLMDYNKKFLIIGSITGITYKEVFPLLRENKIWTGITSPREFIQPDGTIKKFGNICWYTNLENGKRKENMFLYEKYKGNEELYPKYDNYEAINVNKLSQIPCDYDGVMGVPFTIMLNFNPNQFEIVGFKYGNDNKNLRISKGNEIENKFNRVLIRKIKKNE